MKHVGLIISEECQVFYVKEAFHLKVSLAF